MGKKKLAKRKELLKGNQQVPTKEVEEKMLECAFAEVEKDQVVSFQAKYSDRAHSLFTWIGLAPPGNHAAAKLYKGVWDTGSPCSGITQKVVDDLHLKATGKTRVYSIVDSKKTPEYEIDFIFGKQCLEGRRAVRVKHLSLERDTDVCIGMNVISHGDFYVTNIDGRTVFCFRYPAMGFRKRKHSIE